MENRKHWILFFNDDVSTHKELKRSLADYGDTWSIDFSSSPEDALQKLADRPFDAIIIDIHMSGMDGIQFLDTVSQNMPGVMRFVLTGNTTDTLVLKSTQLVHQMIPKPCNMDHVFNVVERACHLRDKMTDPQLLRIITGIKTLPSVPLLYNRLLKELQSENASSLTVGNIIAQDTAMTAKILQLVNSAFFGLSDNVSSPQRAVTILGFNTVKALVLGIQVFSEYQGQANLPISIDALWKHSILVSSLAYSIARTLKLSTQEQENARVSGVLHDIGKLLLLKVPDFFTKVEHSKKGTIPVEAEYKVLGTSHTEMGAYLLGMWGLPTPIVEATIFHHKPDSIGSKKADVITALHIANGLLNMCLYENDILYNSYLDINYLQRIGVIENLYEWTALTQGLIKKTN